MKNKNKISKQDIRIQVGRDCPPTEGRVEPTRDFPWNMQERNKNVRKKKRKP